jgi:hypothetical protein
MTGSQMDTLTSHKLIVTEAKNKPATMAMIPIFANGITQLDNITIEISELSVQQSKNLKGITEDKLDLKEEVINYLIDVAGAIYSHALIIGDKTLQAKVNFKINKVNAMNQNELTDAAAVVLEEAGNIPAQTLADAGISADEMTKFTAAYSQYKGISSSKREAVIDRTSHTDRISDLFAEASVLKRNTLDRLATQFQRKDSEFYNKYKAAANVIHLHGGKKSAPKPAETV